MELETVGKPRMRREEDFLPGIQWWSCIGRKSNGAETGNASGFGRTPLEAWESFCAANPFNIVFDDIDFNHIPF